MLRCLSMMKIWRWNNLHRVNECRGWRHKYRATGAYLKPREKQRKGFGKTLKGKNDTGWDIGELPFKWRAEFQSQGGRKPNVTDGVLSFIHFLGGQEHSHCQHCKSRLNKEVQSRRNVWPGANTGTHHSSMLERMKDLATYAVWWRWHWKINCGLYTARSGSWGGFRVGITLRDVQCQHGWTCPLSSTTSTLHFGSWVQCRGRYENVCRLYIRSKKN